MINRQRTTLFKTLAIASTIVLFSLFLRSSIVSPAPVSPYWEEVILGYDAYSIGLTAKDHHGALLPLVNLESFGDWKPAGYVYAAVPMIRVFGLSVSTIRFPSLFAGVLIVISVMLIANNLKLKWWLAGSIAAVSPWAIHFSRAAWESNLATACIAFAMWLSLLVVSQKRIKLLPLIGTIVFLSFAFYTYHASRLVVPLLSLGIVLFWIQAIGRSYLVQTLRQCWVVLTVGFLSLFVCLLPLFIQGSSSGMLHRFNETGGSAFSDAVSQSNELKEMAGNAVWSRLVYHRYVLYAKTIFIQYASHFSPTFLFLRGDENLRHSPGYFGLFYPFELVFTLLGIFWWIRYRNSTKLLMLYWLAVSIIPASLAYPTPHVLRILNGLPVFFLLVSQGIEITIAAISQRYGKFTARVTTAVILLIYIVGLLAFFRHYNTIYAAQSANDWQYGYQQLFSTLAVIRQQYPDLPVYITREQGRPAAYHWFFDRVDPSLVQLESKQVPMDQGEFLRFQNDYYIGSPEEVPRTMVIVAGSPDFISKLGGSYQQSLAEISSKSGYTIWKVVLLVP